MLLGAGAVVKGASELWNYNRDNYLYDRTMRQEVEMKVSDWRAEQAEQWREDVNDLTGLTEKKMDNYLVVNTLQLGMCVALYTEGRLEPGTPHWLIHFYMLTLSSAFMYLLMSVWLSMHASIVAARERARLRTQFVRLPVPTWQQLENMRTSASSFERLGAKSFRVPFMDTVLNSIREACSSGEISEVQAQGAVDALLEKERTTAKAAGSSANADVDACGSHAQNIGSKTESCPTSALETDWAEAQPMNASGSRRVEATPGNGAPEGRIDTWGLETAGHDIPELMERPLSSNQHVQAVRKAQMHYQSHDAFARVAMAFGSNQLLLAISYYCLGYVSVGDGAPWPAATIAIIMVSLAVLLQRLDISGSNAICGRPDLVLMATGPICAAVSVVYWCRSPRLEIVAEVLVPPGYLAHGLWLLWALKSCGVVMHRGGDMLPSKFRALMYLDVFGFTRSSETKHSNKTNGDYMLTSENDDAKCSPEVEHKLVAHNVVKPSIDSQYVPEYKKASDGPPNVQQLASNIHDVLASWRQLQLDDDTRKRLESLQRRLHAAAGDDFTPIKQQPASTEMSMETSAVPRELTTMPRELSLMSGSALHRECTMSITGSDGLQKMKYITDVGTEVEYFYDPRTGQVQHCEGISCGAPDEQVAPARRMKECLLNLDQQKPDTLDDDLESLGTAEEQLQQLEELQERERGSSQDNLSSGRSYNDSDAFEVTEKESRGRVVPTCPNPLLFNGRSMSCGEVSPGPTSWQKLATHGATELPWLLADLNEGEPSRPHPGSDITDEVARANDDDEHFHRMPWKVFRCGTVLLAVMWLIGPCMLYGMIGGVSEFGPKRVSELGAGPRSFAEQEDPDGTFSGVMSTKYVGNSIELSEEEYNKLLELPPGRLVGVQWPRDSTFAPRSVAIDALGRHIVVSDDFSLYTGSLHSTAQGTIILAEDPSTQGNAPPGALTTPGKLLLRGTASSHQRDSFERVPVCTALEGQALKDVGVVCSLDRSGKDSCRVLVLHTNGRRLTECPLRADGVRENAVEEPVVSPVGEWKISGSWYDADEETVESVAVNDKCDNHKRQFSSGVHTFDPEEVGCVLVGTSAGRVVQLRQRVDKDDQLVPEWAMQERLGKVGQGAIHVYPGGAVLMLRPEIGVLQAFEIHSGREVGQWRLPQTIAWQSLAAGGDFLFLLGSERREQNGGQVDDEIKMWQFALPSELKPYAPHSY